ncbi:RNA polymerase sigma-70 factor (ECF subfamily) [Parabacteroides sp. PF5-5]|uniref:RNA polymerase sigma-70 factor n=1 Tax=unclassified Parabacteroides TaxID=2649774 RepID=UPI0024741A74|nr:MULTISPECIES: RNA polymerase sigma-70 factor [unclassified Parabacteroides]MDH6306445.1 RNA polymerase sigma-70 factor (ECF subfamily) [Parabacteroides sp. PH5-39]MDH6317403.1 RNA polymerase sigma-70 factor (ECF subfamily) [Parabacteroides sp. PF5-13]MDH6321156.1 RNA polymerase sigma-70 factor (ECF subfamily) [Parabacteroides sp. PH5-13]MDH6324888.1 RNA polymerase sigma-70 factor (ECF subfamily) [Parabacteroides sp. PH5-8]MDH6328588.1 RNA polymerase sigma-70 factor (ECF subfamily) [Parabact
MEDIDNTRDLNSLFVNYKERFVRFAKTYVCLEEAAEDIVIDSFMYYWENRTNLANEWNIPAYILTTIKHKCLNHLQRMQKEEEIRSYISKTNAWELDMRIATLEACNPEKLLSSEVQEIIDNALTSLPEQTRDIFVRSRFEKQSHKEIAIAIGLSTKSVEYHITKALKILKSALQDYFPLLPLLLYFSEKSLNLF